MQHLRALAFRATPARTLIETASLGVVLALAGLLAWVLANVSPGVAALLVPGAFAAVRAARLGDTRRQRLRRETGLAALVALVAGGMWLMAGTLAVRAGAVPPEAWFPRSPLLAALVAVLPAVVYVAMRAGWRAWTIWNRARRTRFAWALTHALLMTVVLVSLLFIGVILIPLRQDALPLIGTVIGAMLLVLAGTIVGLLPFFALFSYVFARHTTRRIEMLAAAAGAFRQGQYATRVVVSGEDEIARLQADFNAMAGDLEHTLHALQTERDRVSALMQAQRQLIAAVSHELRTPVATMRGYLEAALHTPAQLPAALQADLAVIERETLRLQSLIDDLFTLARTETQSLTMRCVPTDIGLLSRQIVATVAPLAWQRSRIEVVAEIEPDLPAALVDAARWEQILHNMLHNAVRHTPPGGIVAVTAYSQAAHLVVEVRDTGSGIAADDMPHIFERFYRGAGTPAGDGAGLGLALVNELLEAMGGSIQVDSAPAKGSCFTLCVPLAAQQEAHEHS